MLILSCRKLLLLCGFFSKLWIFRHQNPTNVFYKYKLIVGKSYVFIAFLLKPLLSPNLWTFKEPRNQFQGIDAGNQFLGSLKGLQIRALIQWEIHTLSTMFPIFQNMHTRCPPLLSHWEWLWQMPRKLYLASPKGMKNWVTETLSWRRRWKVCKNHFQEQCHNIQ